jgi:serine/threonine-protein kinase
MPPGPERAQRIGELCGGHASLTGAVEELLAEDAWLQRPAEPGDAHLGARLGHYQVDALIARGGMAAVYAAHRADQTFEQRVAVKIMDVRLADPQLVEQFKAERQILASLDHPALTRLLDGGVTASGEPYLVMEYVDGVPIDRYCDDHRIDLTGRLRLFAEVCEAVTFAHRSLVLHRDLKPSNILVSADGRVKVVDFGTATLLQPTRLATISRAPFTPAYASPEQLTGQPVGTASDQFSLGLVLYELVTGARAFGPDTSLIASVERALAGRTPTAPHTTVTPEAAAARQMSPARLRRRLSGDLGTIVRKSLAAEPQRRYPSVQHLADDLARWVEGAPILGRAPSVAYVASRFVGRHWIAAAMVASLLAGLVAATLVSIDRAGAARRQADVAATEAAKTAQLNRFLTRMMESAAPVAANPDAVRARTITVREVLDRASRTVGAELGATPELEASMRRTLGRSYLSLGLIDEGDAHLERALALFRERGDALEMAVTEVVLSKGLLDSGEFAEGERRLWPALATLRAHADRVEPDVLASAVNNLALAVTRRDPRSAEGLDLMREAIALARRGGTAAAGAANLALNLGMQLLVVGDLAASESMLRDALDLIDRQTPEPPERAWALRQLSELMRTKGNYDEAERYGAGAVSAGAAFLPPDHPTLAVFKTTWGRALAAAGQADRAESALLEAYATFSGLRPPGHQDLLGPQLGLGAAYRRQGRLVESEAILLDAREILSRHPTLLSLQANAAGELGLTLRAEGRTAEATALLQNSFATYQKLLGDGHPYTELARTRLEADSTRR